MPAPVKFGSVTAYLQDGFGFGAEGNIGIQVGNHWAIVFLSCPKMWDSEFKVTTGSHLVSVSGNEDGPLVAEIHIK